MGFLVYPGCFLLSHIGLVDSFLQVLVCAPFILTLTSKNKSYFGCCADPVKELRKVCFYLVSHFPLVLLTM